MKYATQLMMFSVTCGIMTLQSAPMCIARQDYRHAIFRLPKPSGDNTIANGMDERGNVAGWVHDLEATIVPVAWVQSRSPIHLPTFGGMYGAAFDINSLGDVAGSATFEGGGLFNEQAALWRNGQVINLGTLGNGEDSEALAINDLGEIVGWSEMEPNATVVFPFIWRSGAMQRLPDPGNGGGGWASALNNSGLIVGHFAGRAMLWRNEDPPLDLGTLRPDGRGDSIAYDINEAGFIVGGADIDSLKTNAFVWYDGKMTDLGRLPNRRSARATAINNHNQVVGWASSGAPNLDAFYWDEATGMRPVADFLPPNTEWRLYEAWGINDLGQICGNGTLRHSFNKADAYLLSPVTPTMDLDAPSPGSAGVANMITIRDVTPGATVYFVYSRHGGGTRIPGCDLQQNALQLDSPTVIGTAVADQNGVASITRTVPLIARNQIILFQAVVQNECAISQLVVHQFE